MKGILILISLIPAAGSFYIWIEDGFRIAFWQTSVGNQVEVPIIEGMPELGTQTQIVWQERFVSGVETPLCGLALTLALLIFFFLRSRKKV